MLKKLSTIVWLTAMCGAPVSAEAQSRAPQSIASAVRVVVDQTRPQSSTRRMLAKLAAKVTGGFRGIIGSSDRISLELTPPSGHCALSKEGEQEKEIYAGLEKLGDGKSKVFQYSVPCKQLPAFWQGKPMSKWAIYTLSSSALPQEATRTALVAEITKTLPEFKKSEIDKLMKQSSSTELTGIIDVTPDAVFLATVTRDEQSSGAMGLITGITSITLLNNRVVGLNLFADYVNIKTIDDLLADVKEATAKSINATEAKGTQAKPK